MTQRSKLAHHCTSIPHSFFLHEEDYCYDDHAAPVDIGAAAAGTLFVIALIAGSVAAIFGAIVLIVKCISGIRSVFAER